MDDRASSEEVAQNDFHSRNIHRTRAESTSLASSFPNSLNQRTPARSYYQRSIISPSGRWYTHQSCTLKANYEVPDDYSAHVSRCVRQETAELASWALSDASSTRDSSPPCRRGSVLIRHSLLRERAICPSSQVNSAEIEGSDRPKLIDEFSEASYSATDVQPRVPPAISTLTTLIRRSPPVVGENSTGEDSSNDLHGSTDVHVVTVDNGIISQPHEGTSLLKSMSYGVPDRRRSYGALHDVESQQLRRNNFVNPFQYDILARIRKLYSSDWRGFNLPSKGEDDSWTSMFSKPVSHLPAVILGLLLNILDALSYGMTA